MKKTDGFSQHCLIIRSVGGRQAGLSLVMVIFILVVLSLLGTAMIRVLTSTEVTVAREIVAMRALYAAESGAQRELARIAASGSSASCTGDSYSFAPLTSVNCAEVTVTCSVVTLGSDNFYRITSTGKCGEGADQAVRIIEVQAKNVEG